MRPGASAGTEPGVRPGTASRLQPGTAPRLQPGTGRAGPGPAGRRPTAGVGLTTCAALLLISPGMPQGALAAQPSRVDIVDPTTETKTFPLWENGAPGAKGTGDNDVPTLTLFPIRAGSPGSRPGAAVIIAPGGSYQHLAANHEGRQVANWFNALGITAFVLRYRLGPTYHHPIELEDAQRAIRLVRARAAEFGIRPEEVGMMGFSAGGHLTSSASTHFDMGDPSARDPIDRVSSRPDFAILGYPVISMTAEYSHQGSVNSLLGEHPDPKLARLLSSELQVTRDTPPTFLFTTSADTTVPAENSVAYYLALHKAGVPAELHIFEPGPHGVGLALGDPVLGEWSTLLRNWLRVRGLLQ